MTIRMNIKTIFQIGIDLLYIFEDDLNNFEMNNYLARIDRSYTDREREKDIGTEGGMD